MRTGRTGETGPGAGACAPEQDRSAGRGAARQTSAADDPRVAELTAEVAERTADLQRLSAEYANYRRRVDRDREAVLVNAGAQFVGELLPMLDDIDRAGTHGDLTGPFKSVADKLVTVVQKLGWSRSATRASPSTRRCTRPCSTRRADVTGPDGDGAGERPAPRLPHRRPRAAAGDGRRSSDRADDGTTTEARRSRPRSAIPDDRDDDERSIREGGRR